MTAATTGAGRARVDRALTSAILVGAAALVGLFVVGPIGMVLFAAVRTDTPGSPNAAWTLDNLSRVYSSDLVVQPLVNTLLTCVPGTLISVAIGFSMAWLVHRTDIAKPRWLELFMLAPVYFSPLSLAAGWVILAAPRVGLLNVLWPFPGAPLNAYSWTAIVLFIGFYYAPYVYLIVAGGLRSLDAGYEDASAILGAKPLRTLRLVTWPMLRPHVMASTVLVFIISISMFAEPALFGTRFNFINLPLAIYNAILNVPANFNLAAAMGSAMLVGALAGLVLYRWALASAERFVTTQTRGFTIRRTRLAAMRPVALGFAIAYLLAVIVLPVIALLYASFMRFLSARPSLTQLTLEHYRAAWDNPLVTTAIGNTLILSFGVATLTTCFGFLVAYSVVRREIRGAALLDGVSILPIGVPAVVLSLGFLWSYLWAPVDIYGTLWALMLVLATIVIPNTIRAMDAAMRQLGSEVEFAARLLGAGPGRRMLQIVLPMLRGPLIAAWLLAFMVTTIQVSAPIILRTPGQEVLSVAVWSLITDSGDLGQASVVALFQGLIAGLVVVIVRRLEGRHDEAPHA